MQEALEGQECQRHRSVGGVTRGGDPGWRRPWRVRRRSKGRSVSGAEASTPSQGEGRWHQGGGGLGGPEEVKRSGAQAAQKRHGVTGGRTRGEAGLGGRKGVKGLRRSEGVWITKGVTGGGKGEEEPRIEQALEGQEEVKGSELWRRHWRSRRVQTHQRHGRRGGTKSGEGRGGQNEVKESEARRRTWTVRRARIPSKASLG